MKLLAGIVEISKVSIDQYPGDTSGASMIATLSGSASKSETAQVYEAPGFMGSPSKGTKGVRLRIGSIDIVIGTINYGIDKPTNKGETRIYSTDEDGAKKAEHYLDNQGVHTFNDGILRSARENDPTLIDTTTDPTYFVFLQAVASALSLTAPTSITGKITDGTEEVLLP